MIICFFVLSVSNDGQLEQVATIDSLAKSGQREHALKWMDELLQDAQDANDYPTYWLLFTEKSELFLKLNEPKLAEDVINEQFDFCLEKQDKGLTYSRLLRHKAQALDWQGEWDVVFDLVREAASRLLEEGSAEDALDYCERALNFRQETLGENNPATVGCYNYIARALYQMEDEAKGLETCQEAIQKYCPEFASTSFFEEMNKGSSKSRALQTAQMKYLDGAVGQQAHPYYWSGMALIGNDAPIEIDESNVIWWLVFLGIFLLGMAIAFRYKSSKIS